MELVLGPALFGLLGYWLDGRLGTTPVLTVLLALAGLVGVFLRLYYGYANEMDRHEQHAPWVRVGLRRAADAAFSSGIQPARTPAAAHEEDDA